VTANGILGSRNPIWAMTRDVTPSIRLWLRQNGVAIIGAGGGGIGALVRSDACVANVTENIDCSAVGPTSPRFSVCRNRSERSERLRESCNL